MGSEAQSAEDRAGIVYTNIYQLGMEKPRHLEDNFRGPIVPRDNSVGAQRPVLLLCRNRAREKFVICVLRPLDRFGRDDDTGLPYLGGSRTRKTQCGLGRCLLIRGSWIVAMGCFP